MMPESGVEVLRASEDTGLVVNTPGKGAVRFVATV